MKDQDECRTALDNYLSEWRYIHPKSTGDSLRKLGLPPSPAYRQILFKLRAAWLDGEVMTYEQEKKFLSELVEDSKNDDNSTQL
jgi:tRNA nucleotidyltransferase (CCA-adding enzyme)